MKFIILIIFLFIFLLIPLSQADTTFFDQDDAFIMGSSATGEVTGGGTSEGTGSGGSCTYKWNCTNWSECLSSGKQTRNCINIGTCSNKYNSPETEQKCTYAAYVIEKENEEKKPELVLEEKEILAKNEEEKFVEPSENVLAKENPAAKHNYIFYMITLVAVLMLRWIYYHWKEK